MGPFWALFAQIWAKKNFSVKKGSVSFQIFRLSTTVRKMPDGRTDSQTDKTDRQTNRRTENGDLIGAPEGRGSKNDLSGNRS